MKRILITMLIFSMCAIGFSQEEVIPAATEPVPEEEVISDVPPELPEDAVEEMAEAIAKESPFNFPAEVGSETIDGVTYTRIALNPELILNKFGVGLNLVFRINGSGKLYYPDWDGFEPKKNSFSKKEDLLQGFNDVFSMINYVRWDKKGAPIFFKIGILDNVYLGHGSVFYRYSNKLFMPEVRRTGVQFDVNSKKFGFEIFDDDIIDNRIFGGRMYIRPFPEKGLLFLKKLAIGFTAASDIDLDETISINPHVTLVGADIDIPILQMKEFLSLLLYGDYVYNIANTGDGLTAGFLFTVFGFKFRGQLNQFMPYYNGPYFDAFYDLERNTKLATLSQRTNSFQGWGIKMNQSFGELLDIAFEVNGDLGQSGDEPDLHFSIDMKKKIADKVKATFYYNKADIPKIRNVFVLKDNNSMIAIDFAYSITDTVDLIGTYKQTFLRFGSGPDDVQTIQDWEIKTKLNF